MTFKPTVLKADEQHELRWLDRLLVPGLLDSAYSFRLEEPSAGAAGSGAAGRSG
jgi:hypothetical protein